VHRDVVQVEGSDLALLTGNGAALVAHANRPHAGPETRVAPSDKPNTSHATVNICILRCFTLYELYLQNRSRLRRSLRKLLL
jgi:hypothetical protein